MHWIKRTFKKAFDYSGRSQRMEYWVYFLLAAVVLNAVGGIENWLGLGEFGPNGNRPGGLLGTMMTIIVLTVLIPGPAVAVRRLHDANFAGWWLALPAAPVLGWAIMIVVHLSSQRLFPYFIVAIVASPFIVLLLMLLPGTKGANRFGEDPLAPSLADTFG